MRVFHVFPQFVDNYQHFVDWLIGLLVHWFIGNLINNL
jgi:hypothetical protein